MSTFQKQPGNSKLGMKKKETPRKPPAPKVGVERIQNTLSGFPPNRADLYSKLDECGVLVPPFTTDREFVKEEVSSGRAYVAFYKEPKEKNCPFVAHPYTIILPNGNVGLFAKYTPKSAEYKVFVFKGAVVAVAEKKADPQYGKIKSTIRASSNGFTVRGNLVKDAPVQVEDAGQDTCYHLGLRFGVVTVLWNHVRGKAYVCNVYAPPSLKGANDKEQIGDFTKALKPAVESLGYSEKGSFADTIQWEDGGKEAAHKKVYGKIKAYTVEGVEAPVTVDFDIEAGLFDIEDGF